MAFLAYSICQDKILSTSCGSNLEILGGGLMTSTKREPIAGIWEQSHWSGGQGKVKQFWLLDVQ